MILKRFAAAMPFIAKGAKEVFSRPKFIAIAAIPIIIDMGIFITGLTMGSQFLSWALASALAFIFPTADGVWYSLAYYPLLVIFWIVFLVSLSTVVYLIASVISSPFNAFLAEAILVERGYIKPQKLGFVGFLKFNLKMMFIALLRAVILISMSIVLFVFSFLPGVNFITTYLAAIIVSFDAADYTLELFDYTLRQRFQSLKHQLPEYAGMGLVLTFILMLPGFVLLLMPFIVSGATLTIGKSLKEAP